MLMSERTATSVGWISFPRQKFQRLVARLGEVHHIDALADLEAKASGGPGGPLGPAPRALFAGGSILKHALSLCC